MDTMLTQRDVEELDALLLPLELYLPEMEVAKVGVNDLGVLPGSSSPPLDVTDEVISTSSTNESTISVAPQRRKRTSCKTRIEQLREEVVRLKLDLQAARQIAADRIENAKTEERVNEDSSVWALIAARQKRSLEKSEAMNMELRRLVLAQHRHLRSSLTYLKRRPNRQLLSERLDPEFGRLDELRLQSNLSGLTCPSQRFVTSRCTVAERKFFDAINCMKFPFRMKAVGNSLWKHLGNLQIQDPSTAHSEFLDCQGDTLRVLVATSNDEFNLQQTFYNASRIYEEEDRVVVVTAAMSEPRIPVGVAVVSVKLLSTIIRVVKPCKTLSTGDSCSVLETYWSTQVQDTESTRAIPTDKFVHLIDIGMSILQQSMTAEQEIAEELLFAELKKLT